MNSQSFGELIKYNRVAQGKALREVASDIRFDQSLLSKIERNKIEAPQKIIKPLAKSLDLDYKDLQIKYLSDKLYRSLNQVDYPLEALKKTIEKLEQGQISTSYEAQRRRIIKGISNYFEQAPVDKAWIFGSFARKEEKIDSDIDLLVQFSKADAVDLFDYIGIRHDLEDITGRQVDLVEKGQEADHIKEALKLEKQLIYERKETFAV